ncbi:transcriptional regulator, LysR family [Pseudomonas synxantha]|uniref:LysR family transcriptional regulator n=1 Tax=Pseudomonas synxantha TaxID=47883 RepID=A0AAX3I5I9_9PSED|nr:LysR family transcriptional regulator [Pseudomonas synxantha]AZE67948.1 Transcriptional regulator, LysR family [Pseudomonas synxantha]KRP47658.1 LysR family transcriptional regulator [Pseudomonas synxantha]SDU15800.1 transcriptional regulator, LysR family [Pseudomonas synxantha]VTQ96967.1 LysR family transcriptional regulator [Pseudomonas synxantha]
MDNLGSLSVFVQVADTRSFTAAGRILGVSSSAVGKSIARMEERLGVRLFHRSTRSITLTSEGGLFLERSRRILAEVEAAEQELTQASATPRGKLRISVPQVRGLLMPVISDFMRAYPEIELDVDFSDRMVDVIEEGFDAVIRTGKPEDSRLMARHLGHYQLVLVGTPGYFEQHGIPSQPQHLDHHACLRHKFCATGKLEPWPLRQVPGSTEPSLRTPLVSTTIESLYHVVQEGLGIACLPDYMVNQAVSKGQLQRVLDEHLEHRGSFWLLWPASRHASAKLRVFIDHMCAGLFPTDAVP